jgi:acyl dehydratase
MSGGDGMASEDRFYEDIVVGSEREIGRHQVSRDEIIRFATDWDPQPFHIDEEAARASVFGELTASSCHTYSLSSLIFHRGTARLRTVAMLGMDSCRFPTPMRPGDEVRLVQTILEKRRSGSRPHLGIIKGRTQMLNGAGETLMEMTSNFMVEARPSS